FEAGDFPRFAARSRRGQPHRAVERGPSEFGRPRSKRGNEGLSRMSYDYGGWKPYVPVAKRRRQTARTVEKLRKKGQSVAPVTIEGRRIVTSFWGRAWCDTIESYRDYAYRLERGRSYVRNGAVVDLHIAPGQITALVNGSALYRTTVTVAPTPPAKWHSIRADCTGRIESLVELLQGRVSKPGVERLLQP